MRLYRNIATNIEYRTRISNYEVFAHFNIRYSLFNIQYLIRCVSLFMHTRGDTGAVSLL